MWPRTPYLELLVLCCTIAPAQLAYVAISARPPRAGVARPRDTIDYQVAGAYLGVGALVCVIEMLSPSVSWPPIPWRASGPLVLVGALTGVLAFAAEATVGTASAYRTGQRRMRLRANLGGRRLDAKMAGSILLVAVVEELLYRGVWIGVLRSDLHVPDVLAVSAAAAGYAAGHLYFGGLTVVQKLVSGVMFGALFVATGTIVVAVIAHLSLNIVVLGLARARDGVPQ